MDLQEEVIMPWMIGTTAEAHRGKPAVFFVVWLLCFRAISSLITAGRQFVSP
jgi:hypothetical protein